MITRQVLRDATPVQVAGDPGAARALVVLQEAFGVNDHIRSLLEMFADAGFYAAAPELFWRAGSPEIDYDRFPDAMSALATLSREGLEEDLAATAGLLASAGFASASIGVVGYCMGGSVSLFAATTGLVGAAVSFYGGGVENGRFGLPPLVELAPDLRAPWLGLYGDLDQGIPPEQVEALRGAARRASVASEIVRYADAAHGFNCDGRPAVFNPAASADATRRTLAFLAENLAAR